MADTPHACESQDKQEAYIKGSGQSCPKCGSKDLEGGSLQSDCAVVWQNIDCKGCGAYWTDQYDLTGFNNFHEEDPDG